MFMKEIKRYGIFFFIAMGFLQKSYVSAQKQYPADISGEHSMTLVWCDEFDSGSVPSAGNWVHDTGTGNGGWGNNESETYTSSSDNASVSNGILTVKAIKTGGVWTSARLKTSGLHSWKYGYIEARMKVPPEKGTWPAFWMLPEDRSYGTWPCSGEIDIMEHAPSTSGLNTVHSTVHYGDSAAGHTYASCARKTIAGASTGFHTYGVEWTASFLKFYYDGTFAGSAYYKNDRDWTEWPFDKKFHIIINLAMGGTLGGTIDSSITSAEFQIDWIRVWKEN
jgi:beta-glucanase (GH16 family)